MTKDGADWLLCALDPFHDFKLRPEGYPDMRSGNSIVQMHTQKLDIDAGAIGANWDCQILYTGYDFPATRTNPSLISGVSANKSFKWNLADGATTRLFNSFTVTKAAAGTSCGLLGTGTTTTLASALAEMPARLIGVGFEIHNTTSELYKQGTLTVAQLPDHSTDDMSITYYSTDASVANKDFQAEKTCRFPTSSSEVAKIPGSNTWEARDGVYCIPRMQRADIPVTNFNTSRSLVVDADTVAGNVAAITPVGIQAVTLLPYLYGVSRSSFNPMAVYLTNLSKESTFTLTVKTFVEYFPPVNGDFISLSSPSPMYDPKALKMYFDVASTAPYAVKVNMNAAGDYFRMIFNAMSKFGPTVGSIIPGPIAKVVGMGVGGVGDLGNAVLNIIDSRKKTSSPTVITPAKLANVKKAIVSKNTAGRSAVPTRR